MRLRRTAPPSAFLMLQPNRLRSRPLGRRNSVNSRLDLRRPSRYTASYSARRTNRQARGKPSSAFRSPLDSTGVPAPDCDALDARETVASLLAALRKDFPSTLALHACAEPVLLVTGAHMGLKGAFRQRSLSSAFAGWAILSASGLHLDAPRGHKRIN
jgi:hypothetical protein